MQEQHSLTSLLFQDNPVSWYQKRDPVWISKKQNMVKNTKKLIINISENAQNN